MLVVATHVGARYTAQTCLEQDLAGRRRPNDSGHPTGAQLGLALASLHAHLQLQQCRLQCQDLHLFGRHCCCLLQDLHLLVSCLCYPYLLHCNSGLQGVRGEETCRLNELSKQD